MIKLRKPLILASHSEARKAMLEQAGVECEAIATNTDESRIIENLVGEGLEKIATVLAEKKALAVAQVYQGRIVIGADQILVADGKIFSKAKTVQEAREKLTILRGRKHHLISAVAIAESKSISWSCFKVATLTMRDFDDAFLDTYIDHAGDALTACVGSYAVEKHGAWLFDDIDGDMFTIMGMPLLQLLEELRLNYAAEE